MQAAGALTQERELLNGEVQKINGLVGDISAYQDLAQVAETEEDREEIGHALLLLAKEVEKMRYLTLFSGEHDDADAIISIKAGAGGDDAQDWSQMLLRMYIRWAECHEMKVIVTDRTEGAEAGIKSATIEIQGVRVYGQLRGEHGVHRLVRLSPFNSDNLRQTSFAQVEVMPIIEALPEVEIKPEDLRIDTFRSSGAGGQSVNTTDSAVRVTHIPTGIVASCQNERSQGQNKLHALKIVTAKLHQRHLEEQLAKNKELRGEQKANEWGSQIRSYILHPYKMVKDHRTTKDYSQVEAVLDGNLDAVISDYLVYNVGR